MTQVSKMQKSELKKLIQSLIAWPYYLRAIGLKDQMVFWWINSNVWWDCFEFLFRYLIARSVQVIFSSWAFKQLSYIFGLLIAWLSVGLCPVIISWLWPGERNIKPNISCFSPRLKSDLCRQKHGSQSGDTGLGYMRLVTCPSDITSYSRRVNVVK